MNWLAFWSMIGGLAVAALVVFAMALASEYLEGRVGLGWSMAIVIGALCMAGATFAGLTL